MQHVTCCLCLQSVVDWKFDSGKLKKTTNMQFMDAMSVFFQETMGLKVS